MIKEIITAFLLVVGLNAGIFYVKKFIKDIIYRNADKEKQ